MRETSELPRPSDFVGPFGNATDKYSSRNPLQRALLTRFLSEIERLVRSVAPGSILDVGCGEGVVTERLARSTGAATTGVDLGTPELEAHWRRREGDGISFRAASTYDLPFDDDSFDCVCAIEVLEHLERPRDALAELARVSQGAMLLSVPREPLWRMAHLAAGRDVRSLGNTPGHINHWSSRRFRSLVAEFGHVLAVVRPHPWTVVLARPHTLAERPHGASSRARTRPARRSRNTSRPTHRRGGASEQATILAVTSSYPRYEDDPIAPFIESVTRHVAARGHTTHLVLPESRAWHRPPEENGIHYHPFRYSPRRSWTPWGYAASLERGTAIRKPLYALAPVVLVSGIRACARVLAESECDVVHAHWVVPNGPIAAYVARRHRLPLVISLHGTDISISEQSWWLGRLSRRVLAQADVVTAPSEDLLQRARRLGARGRLELVPYGADPTGFEPDQSSRREVRERLGLDPADVAVLGIGRFIPLKGFEYLISAVAQARSAEPGIRLVLVGDGDLRGDLEERVAASGLGDAATFTGMVGREEIPAYYAAADLVAVPSVHHQGYVDGLPNVALEAMATARPLIASRVGGLPDLVREGEDGLLVTERDVDGLAAAIVTLAGDPSLRQAMGERGRQRVIESMTWDAVADRFVELYAWAAAHGAARTPHS